MTELDDAIDKVDTLAPPAARRLPLPSDQLIARYENEIGLSFPADYKRFLKTVSNAFVGTLSPLILNEEMGGIYGELRTATVQAREGGLPADWLPICEDNGDYYCVTPDGRIRFWDHNGASDESWDSIADWVEQIWLA